MIEKYIDPFVNDSISSMRDSMDIEIDRGETRPHPAYMEGIVVIIGITGDLEGRIIYEFTEETALKISEAMNYEPFDSFNELAQSTICELANIMSGKAVSGINDGGTKISITPPVLLTGKEMSTTDKTCESCYVILKTNMGPVGLSLGLKVPVAAAHK